MRHGVFVFDRQGAVLDFLKGVPAASGLAVGKDGCLLYTSDAADERSSVDLGGRRIIKKKTTQNRSQT